MLNFIKYFLIFLINNQILSIYSFVLPGILDFNLRKDNNVYAVYSRGLYNETKIQLRMTCEQDTSVKIGWLLKESPCMDEFYIIQNSTNDLFIQLFKNPDLHLKNDLDNFIYIKSDPKEYKCEHSFIEFYSEVELKPIHGNSKNPSKTSKIPIPLPSKKIAESINIDSNNNTNSSNKVNNMRKRREGVHNHDGFDTLAKAWSDGIYLFIVYSEPVDNRDYDLKATVSFKYKSGYLSANDWPFLPFYAVMCAIYIIYALIWFTCSCCYFKDIIRVQFWIGAVILLGMIEKAAYLAEYESVNRNGYTAEFGLILAEFISCLKRSLARMLVIIVSLGFGIVKPRLGPTLQKVVAVGVLYFVLAAVDGTFRILGRKEDTDNKGILASIPLAVLDVSVCYWILTNLQQTMRTLRVRRNVPKLTLYRHFTNTLIFCVISSVIFMVWSLKRHRFMMCLKDWKELWLDDGFWHILFSFILLVIIILWRPSNNSQRFVFSPLIDNDDEEGLMQDDNQENEVFDSIKMRSKIETNKPKQRDKTIEDELKWVEEHVPTSVAETALPAIIDSDEEVMTTRFEISKMD